MSQKPVAEFSRQVGSGGVPLHLYGRQQHVEKIMLSLKRVNRGNGGLVLLPGVSGSGKTTLAEVLKEPTAAGNGYFLQGKFNQYDQNVPYVAWRQALSQFCKTVVREDQIQKTKWSERICEAVGSNGQLLVDLVPDFEDLIGKQVPVPSISPAEARHRFAGVIRHLLKAICRSEHPIVLFIDDWQWADTASLYLLADLQTGEELKYLLLVAAYRCDEVAESHQLNQTLALLGKQDSWIETIGVENLDLKETEELVAGAGLGEEVAVSELATNLHAVTQGNPFFVHALLNDHQHRLSRVKDNGKAVPWVGSELEYHNGVVEIFSERIADLDLESQRLVSYAACIGHRFDLETLSLISGLSLTETKTRLDSLSSDLIVPLNEVAEKNFVDGEAGRPASCWYRFSHDRVQQAAYSRIAIDELLRVRLEIGRRFLAELSPEQLADRVCEVVEHINFSRALIDDAGEKIRVIELNVAAASKAKSGTAFRAALQYHRAARDLMQDSEVSEIFWATHHKLGMQLLQGQAETEFFEGDSKASEACIRMAVEKAGNAVERSESLGILVVHFTLQARYSEAIQTGREALEVLGIRLPDRNFEEARDAEIARTRSILKELSFARIKSLPVADDEGMCAAARVLITMGPPCYRSHQALWSVIVPMVVNITLVHGHMPQAGYSYPAFAGLLGWCDNDYGNGREFAELATHLMSQSLATPSDQAIFYLMVGSSARHWTSHLSQSSEDYTEAYRVGVRSGNLQYAAYAFGHNMYCRFFQGTELERLIEESEASLAFSRTRHNQWAIDLLEGGIRLFSELSEQPFPDFCLETSESEYVSRVQANQNQQVECIYLVLKSQISLILGKRDLALQTSRQADALIHMVGTQGLLPWPEHVFTQFLSLALQAPHHPGETGQTQKLDDLLSQIRIWADCCPENFEHKYLLASAEMARLNSKHDEAAHFYDRAIDSACQHGFLQWEGFACERASRLWQSLGLQRIEQSYWQQAFNCFNRWGAKAKLRSMEAEFREYIAEIPNSRAESGWMPGNLSSDQLKQLQEERVKLLVKQSNEFSDLRQQADQASSVDELADVADSLRTDIAARRKDSQELRRQRDLQQSLNDELERRVKERTVALSKAESRFRNVLESAPIAMVMVSDAGAISLINSATEDLFGYRRDELVHMSIDQLFSSETTECFKICPTNSYGGLHLIHSQRGQTPRCRRKDGGVFPVELGINPVSIDGVSVLLCAILDITEQQKTLEATQKARQEAESANRAKSTFLATMSHEIRTPMNGILGTCQLALSTDLDEEQCTYMVTMQQSAEALLDIINDILDLSKIEAGKLQIESEAFNPNQVLLDVYQLLKPNAESDGILMRCQVDPNAQVQLLGDHNRLRQVLMNLVGNAVKFTASGYISLSSELVENEDGHESVKFTVQDTGVGIPKDKLGTIFDPFSQVDSSDDRRFGGTGLGLSISSKLVNLMGGELLVESELNQGTRFEFTLRFPQANRVRESEFKPKLAAKSSVPLRVLLAEDNATNQLVAKTLLTKWGHFVSVAENGGEAVAAFKKQDYDLILMDVQMPEMDGLEATRQIREHERESGNRIYIIALTAGAMASDRDKCLSAGMDEYLSKPIRWGKLNECLERLGASNLKNTNEVDDQFYWDLTSAIRDMAGDASLLEEAFGVVLEDLDVKVVQLSDSVADHNLDAITEMTDKIRESAQFLQLRWLEELIASIEERSVGRDWPQINQLLEDLKRNTPRLKLMLKRFVASETTNGGVGLKD